MSDCGDIMGECVRCKELEAKAAHFEAVAMTAIDENEAMREAAQALIDDIGDTYDESSGYHRIRVWVDGDLVDALAKILDDK